MNQLSRQLNSRRWRCHRWSGSFSTAGHKIIFTLLLKTAQICKLISSNWLNSSILKVARKTFLAFYQYVWYRGAMTNRTTSKEQNLTEHFHFRCLSLVLTCCRSCCHTIVIYYLWILLQHSHRVQAYPGWNHVLDTSLSSNEILCNAFQSFK